MSDIIIPIYAELPLIWTNNCPVLGISIIILLQCFHMKIILQFNSLFLYTMGNMPMSIHIYTHKKMYI